MALSLGKFQVVDHVGSGGTAAVVRGFFDGEYSEEKALKLLDPRTNRTGHEQDNSKFEHPNLLRIDDFFNLHERGFTDVPDWYRIVLDCEPEPFVPHPVENCDLTPKLWRRQHFIDNESLSEFSPSEHFILSMEYLPISLAEYVQSVDRSREEIIGLLADVCAGLTAMHTQGVEHGDVGLDNLFVTREGTVKIADFGFSERHDVEFNSWWDMHRLGELAFELFTGRNIHHYIDKTEAEIASALDIDGSILEICKRATLEGTEAYATVDEIREAFIKAGGL